jgi:hypothetical protein
MSRQKGDKKPKMSQAQVIALKKELVRGLLNKHWHRKDFYKYCKEEHGLGLSRAKELYTECWDDIQSKYELDVNKQVAKFAHHYWELYDIAREREDINAARNCLSDLTKIFGLLEHKVSVTTQDIELKFGDEE